MADATVITVQHPPTVSAADILNIVNSTVETADPVVVSALPQSANSNRISAYVSLGEVGLAIITAIVNGIQAKHQAALAAQNQAAAENQVGIQLAPKQAGII